LKSKGSPVHVSALPGPACSIRYPASYPHAIRRRTGTAACGFLSLFSCRHSLLGHPFPPGVPPPLLSAYRPRSALADPRRTHGAGFTRSTRVRPGPGRALSLPRGLRCSPTTDGPWPSPAASQRLVPFIPALQPNPGSRVTRHQQEFPVSRPMPVLPLACNRHGWGSGP
jgi:hypothetical protein